MLVVGEGVQESGHSRLLSVVCCSVFFSVDKAWSGGVSIAVLPARDPFSMLTVFVAGLSTAPLTLSPLVVAGA